MAISIKFNFHLHLSSGAKKGIKAIFFLPFKAIVCLARVSDLVRAKLIRYLTYLTT